MCGNGAGIATREIPKIPKAQVKMKNMFCEGARFIVLPTNARYSFAIKAEHFIQMLDSDWLEMQNKRLIFPTLTNASCRLKLK